MWFSSPDRRDICKSEVCKAVEVDFVARNLDCHATEPRCLQQLVNSITRTLQDRCLGSERWCDGDESVRNARLVPGIVSPPPEVSSERYPRELLSGVAISKLIVSHLAHSLRLIGLLRKACGTVLPTIHKICAAFQIKSYYKKVQ